MSEQIETQADYSDQTELAPKTDSDTDKQVEYDEEDLNERDNEEQQKKNAEQQIKITQLEQKLKKAQEESDEEEQQPEEHDEHEDEEEWGHVEWKRNFGNHVPFLFVNGEPLITIGPNWFVNLFMIVFLVSSNVLVAKYLQTTSTQFNIIFALSLALNISYILTSLTNPGIKSSKYPINEDEVKFQCETCEIIEEKHINAHHCFECDVCIEEADFHFIWIGKCVGKGNKSYFVFFALTFLVYIFFTLFIFIKSPKE